MIIINIINATPNQAPTWLNTIPIRKKATNTATTIFNIFIFLLFRLQRYNFILIYPN